MWSHRQGGLQGAFVKFAARGALLGRAGWNSLVAAAGMVGDPGESITLLDPSAVDAVYSAVLVPDFADAVDGRSPEERAEEVPLPGLAFPEFAEGFMRLSKARFEASPNPPPLAYRLQMTFSQHLQTLL